MHTVIRGCLLLLLVGTAARPAAAQFAAVAPDEAGFSAERLARLDAVIEQHIADEQLAGAVMLVLRDGQAVHLQPYGLRDREAGTPMTTDTIFRIASMSKAVTTVAVMMLYEEGHFLLDDPLHRYIPAFENMQVAVATPDGSEPAFRLEPARQPITIHHLLTHQAGLTYGNGVAQPLYEAAELTGWYFADKTEPIGAAIERLATLPLHAHPGEAWQYGYSTDVLGYFVEVVSGMPLDRFFQERIFEPLGMTDSHFFLPPEKAGRLANVYGLRDGDMVLEESNATTDYLNGPRQCFSGGAGLLSTTTDYGRFLQMLLNGGELDGVRLLSPKTVALMRSIAVPRGEYPWDVTGFGLGFWVIDDLGAFGSLGSVGAYGWGSAYYPIYWIDPQERLAAVFMTQLRPSGGLRLQDTIPGLVYQALVE